MVEDLIASYKLFVNWFNLLFDGLKEYTARKTRQKTFRERLTETRTKRCCSSSSNGWCKRDCSSGSQDKKVMWSVGWGGWHNTCIISQGKDIWGNMFTFNLKLMWSNFRKWIFYSPHTKNFLSHVFSSWSFLGWWILLWIPSYFCLNFFWCHVWAS